MLAQYVTGTILGAFAGQIGGGVIGEHFGWRATFLVISFVYTFAFAGLLMEFWRSLMQAQTPVAARTLRRSFIDFFQLLLRPSVQYILAVSSAEALAMFGAFTYIGASLRYRFDFSYSTIGLYIGTFCIGGIIYVALSRFLIRLLGPAHLCFYGALLLAISFAALALTPIHQLYLPAITLMGLAFYMVHNTLQTWATLMAPDVGGSALAMFSAVFFLSQSGGVYLAGIVVVRYGTSALFLGAAFVLVVFALVMLFSAPRWLTSLRSSA